MMIISKEGVDKHSNKCSWHLLCCPSRKCRSDKYKILNDREKNIYILTFAAAVGGHGRSLGVHANATFVISCASAIIIAVTPHLPSPPPGL